MVAGVPFRGPGPVPQKGSPREPGPVPHPAWSEVGDAPGVGPCTPSAACPEPGGPAPVAAAVDRHWAAFLGPGSPQALHRLASGQPPLAVPPPGLRRSVEAQRRLQSVLRRSAEVRHQPPAVLHRWAGAQTPVPVAVGGPGPASLARGPVLEASRGEDLRRPEVQRGPRAKGLPAVGAERREPGKAGGTWNARELAYPPPSGSGSCPEGSTSFAADQPVP
mmetsp:Transcript_73044/g.171285  ORF Transcript_73044/g.171285 Transcript_73044/m.171285 type:complete len:220 (-) Transcript_73044:526-1185(-)